MEVLFFLGSNSTALFSDPPVLLNHLPCVPMAMRTPYCMTPLSSEEPHVKHPFLPSSSGQRAEVGMNLGSLKLMPYLIKVATGLS